MAASPDGLVRSRIMCVLGITTGCLVSRFLCFVMLGAVVGLFAHERRARGLVSWHGLSQSSQSFDRLFSSPNPRILLLPAARGMVMAENTSFARQWRVRSLQCSGLTCHAPAHRTGGRACWLAKSSRRIP